MIYCSADVKNEWYYTCAPPMPPRHAHRQSYLYRYDGRCSGESAEHCMVC